MPDILFLLAYINAYFCAELTGMFTNKVVAITGGTDGIGKALVQQFLQSGAKVSTCGRHEAKLHALEAELHNDNLLAVKADVSVETDCKIFILSTIKTFGTIDILINNAGISMRALFADTDIATLKRVMDINFWGSVYCTKAALREIMKNKGVIVGVSSIAGYRGLPGRSGYSASKFALNGWLEALRTEMLSHEVHVMWVCPGFTSSNIRNAALNAEAVPQGESPLDEGKLMSADECARHIIKAIDDKKRTLILTATGKQTVYLNRFFPAFADKMVKKFFYKNNELIK